MASFKEIQDYSKKQQEQKIIEQNKSIEVLVTKIEQMFYDMDVDQELVGLTLKRIQSRHEERLKSIVDMLGLKKYRTEYDINQHKLTIKLEKNDA